MTNSTPNNKTDFSAHVLDAIKQQDIQPRARWKFLIREYSLWSLWAVTVLAGSLGVAVLIHMERMNDWDTYEHMSDSLLEFIIVTLPYFWLVILVIFALVAHYQFQYTRHGYRRTMTVIMLSNIGISLLLGSVLYVTGVGSVLHYALGERVPIYNSLIRQRHDVWLQPEQGLLSGYIVTQPTPTHFKLLDPTLTIWYVQTDNVIVFTELLPLQPGTHVRIIGKQIDNHTFAAEQILPWMPHFFIPKEKYQHFDNTTSLPLSIQIHGLK